MNNPQPMSHKIIKVFLIGILVQLVFYGVVLYESVHYTENKNSERRMALVAPFHFKQQQHNQQSVIQIDPMLTIYKSYELLPDKIKQRLEANSLGFYLFHYDDDSEFSVFSANIEGTMFYAVQDVDAIEWRDIDLILLQVATIGGGLFIFIIATLFSIKMARRISYPFNHLAAQLESKDSEHKDSKTYIPLTMDGEPSNELMQMLTAINGYRQRIHQALVREQSFARYVSHELRTPMTVIQGSLSVLRRVDQPKVTKQIKHIDSSVKEMELLTRTFLLLARDEINSDPIYFVGEKVVEDLALEFAATIKANEVQFDCSLERSFNLACEPLLFNAVVGNLLKNAFNCSVGGKVDLVISPQAIKVIDNGIGLDEKPRGYEGFGIGLNIVRDICDKYQWQFTIENNKDKGCSATVVFNNSFR